MRKSRYEKSSTPQLKRGLVELNLQSGSRRSSGPSCERRPDIFAVQCLITRVLSTDEGVRKADMPDPNWVRVNTSLPLQGALLVVTPYIGEEPFESLYAALSPELQNANRGRPNRCVMYGHLPHRSRHGVLCEIEQLLSVRQNSGVVGSPSKSQARLNPSENLPETFESIRQYILTDEEMRREAYPRWDDAEDNPAFVVTGPPEDIDVTDPGITMCSRVEDDPAFYLLKSMDCEMVETTLGEEVARVSIVDVAGSVVFDEYIRPKGQIIDYRTEHSGIVEEDMRHASMTLEQVQKELLNVIGPHTILVGHSLDNDLRALRCYHPRCIDTAIIFPHKKPPFKYSLKVLASKLLGEDIAREKGHDSVIDARMALKVFLYKVRRGIDFLGRPFSQHFRPLGSVLAKARGECVKGSQVVVYDSAPERTNDRIFAEQICEGAEVNWCANDEEVVSRASSRLREYAAVPGKAWPLVIVIIRSYQELCFKAVGVNLAENNSWSQRFDSALEDVRNMQSLPRNGAISHHSESGWPFPLDCPISLYPQLGKKAAATTLKRLAGKVSSFFELLPERAFFGCYSLCGDAARHLALRDVERHLRQARKDYSPNRGDTTLSWEFARQLQRADTQWKCSKGLWAVKNSRTPTAEKP